MTMLKASQSTDESERVSFSSDWSRSICSNPARSSPCDRDPDLLLLHLLAVAQGLQIAYLPIVSQKALDLVGVGATANIRQLLVNIEASLAIKTLNWASDKTIDNLRQLISEIKILGSRSFRNHPNIIRLEGICWEPGRDREVHPALVFEKSSAGNLWDFMSSEDGEALRPRDRVHICACISDALRDLHDGRM